MNESFQFLVQNGYAVLFVWVLIDQVGLPLPVLPLLLAAGALSGAGELNAIAVVLLAALASFLSNIGWYEIGRSRGTAILSLVCGMSLDPGLCVRWTKDMFARHGKRSIVVAKFVPGLNAVAAPVAGLFEMPRHHFLMLNGLGACLWAGGFIGIGYLFSSQIDQVLDPVLRLGGWLVAMMAAAFGAYAGLRYFLRRRYFRFRDEAQITPEELKQKLDRGEDPLIVDLRHPLDYEADPRTLPGAVRMEPDEVLERHRDMSPGREVVLHCT